MNRFTLNMSIPFSRQPSTTNLSITSKQSSTRATAQEVYDQMYGTAQTRESVEAALQRIYEPNASRSCVCVYILGIF